MNIEQKDKIEKINKITEEIEKCNRQIKIAEYTQYEQLVIRETYLTGNGIDGQMIIPETLFRIIGRLVLSEYQQKLNALEKELDKIL